MEPKEGEILFSIDPGEATGVAMFRGSRLALCLTVDGPRSLRILRRLMDEHPEADYVLEAQNHRGKNPTAGDAVRELVRRLARTEVHTLRPTDWKGHPKAVLLSTDNTGSRHERDAVKMGRRFLARG